MSQLVHPPILTPYSLSTDDVLTLTESISGTKSGSNPWVNQSPVSQLASWTIGPVTRGYRIDHFRERSAKGELLPLLPFTQFESSGEIMASEFLRVRTVSGTTHQCRQLNGRHLGQGTEDVDGRIVIRLDHALSRLLPDSSFYYDVQSAAAAAYSSGHDSLTFLAELHKVRNLFRGTVIKLLSLQLPPGVKTFASAWAEARYGWRTLIFDLQDLSDAIQNFDDKRKRVKERRGHTETQTFVEVLSTDGPSTTNCASSLVTQDIRTETVETSVRGLVVADFAPPRFSFNVAVTAWELLPWSFVIDWLVNVGQALSALSFLVFSGDYVASAGFRQIITRNVSRNLVSKGSDTTVSPSPKIREATAVSTLNYRKPTVIPSVPQFRLRLDGFKVTDLMSFLLSRR